MFQILQTLIHEADFRDQKRSYFNTKIIQKPFPVNIIAVLKGYNLFDFIS